MEERSVFIRLAPIVLGRETIPITDLIGTGKSQLTFDSVETGRACEYSGEDADVAFRLCAPLPAQATYDQMLAIVFKPPVRPPSMSSSSSPTSQPAVSGPRPTASATYTASTALLA